MVDKPIRPFPRPVYLKPGIRSPFVAWDNDAVREIVSQLGRVPSLWLLAMSKVPRVGTGRARNYHVFPGKIKSVAKDLGADVPDDAEIRQAFQRLTRSTLETPDGRSDTIILGDKPDYVKLTDHGITLLAIIDNSCELKQFVKKTAGGQLEDDQEADWWPEFGGEVPEDAPVQFRAVSDPPPEGTDRYTLDVVARFLCPEPSCRERLKHEYSIMYPDEAYTKDVSVECPECGQAWKHKAGYPYPGPVAADN